MNAGSRPSWDNKDEPVVARASRPCVGCTIRTGGTPVPGVWTFLSPNGAPSQSPTLSRDCGTTLGWRANTTATPTGLRLLSRSCRSLLVIWFPDEVERALGRNRVY